MRGETKMSGGGQRRNKYQGPNIQNTQNKRMETYFHSFVKFGTSWYALLQFVPILFHEEWRTKPTHERSPPPLTCNVVDGDSPVPASQRAGPGA